MTTPNTLSRPFDAVPSDARIGLGATQLMDRRHVLTADLFLQTHEALLEELMVYKREALGGHEAARYHSGLVSLLTNETKHRDLFTQALSKQLVIIEGLKRRIAEQDGNAREMKARHEFDLTQVKLAREDDLREYDKKLKLVHQDSMQKVKAKFAKVAKKIQWSFQDLRSTLAEFRSSMVSSTLLNASELGIPDCVMSLPMQSPSATLLQLSQEPAAANTRSSNASKLRQAGALVVQASFKSAASPTPSMVMMMEKQQSLLAPSNMDWQTTLVEVVESLKPAPIQMVPVGCQCTVYTKTKATSAHDLQPVLLERSSSPMVLRFFSDSDAQTDTIEIVSPSKSKSFRRVQSVSQLSVPSLEKQQSFFSPSSPTSIPTASAAPTPTTTCAEDALVQAFQLNTKRRLMIHWMRRLQLRKRKAFGAFIKNRVAAVLGVELKGSVEVAIMPPKPAPGTGKRGAGNAAAPAAMALSPRRPATASSCSSANGAASRVGTASTNTNRYPTIESIESVRCRIEADRKVDFTAAKMTTSNCNSRCPPHPNMGQGGLCAALGVVVVGTPRLFNDEIGGYIPSPRRQ